MTAGGPSDFLATAELSLAEQRRLDVEGSGVLVLKSKDFTSASSILFKLVNAHNYPVVVLHHYKCSFSTYVIYQPLVSLYHTCAH